MKPMLHIEVGFDVICPWCLIGMRNLQAAIARLRACAPEAAVHVHWRGVQLLPNVPAAGWPFMEFYRQRLGGDAAVRRRQAQVSEAAAAAGVRIDYQRIRNMPNTADAHRLLRHAAQNGSAAQRDALLERLFTGYFQRGEDVGDPAVLLTHGLACGMERADIAPLMLGAAVPFQADGVGNGNGGVPYYVVNGKLVASGAQPPEVLLAAMLAALEPADAVAS
ncbi:MAG TPA: DsbA family oxidoreductase [Burkholderiaceae bacterium]|nr:DsbA family oxidoreductase [Burkholderiaceae bacterium]